MTEIDEPETSSELETQVVGICLVPMALVFGAWVLARRSEKVKRALREERKSLKVGFDEAGP